MFYKNNKAFTIYELLAIFAILAINMLLTLPAIVDIVENSREKAFEIQMSNIKSAARIYMLKLDLDDNAIITIPLFVLQKEGLLEPNMKNPKTNEIYNDCMPIRIKKFDNFYTYQIETDLEEYSCNIDESVSMTLVGSYNDETVKDSQYVDEGIIVKNSSGEKIDESLIKVKITKTINGNSQILDDIYYDELSDQILTDDYYQYKLEYIYNDSSIIRFVNVVDYTSKILEFYKPTILISNGSDNSKNVVINDNQAGTYLIKSFKNITSNKDVTLCSNVDGAAFECNGSTTRNLSAGVWYKVVDLTTIFNFTEKGSIVVKVSDGYNYNTNSAIVSAGELVVTLDANGGTLSTNTIKVYNGEIYGNLPTPTREGYTFLGWYFDNNYSEKVENSTIVSNHNNHTLYAYFVTTLTNNKVDYDYTGSSREFIAPQTGTYKIELWGAQGGFGYDDTTSGATGGYTSGVISLDVKQKLYFYIGQVGNDTQGITTFNNGTASLDGWNGGGATDVRILNGNWNNFDSIKSRIMVAAGGGTEYQSGSAGASGGLIGYSGGGTSGGTQTTFGLVENSTYTASLFGIANGGCTGGNGYNPGGGAICANGSGGGSSFISGYSGCDAVSSSSTENNIIYTGQPNHYSGKVFTNGVMIDGLGCDWSTGEAANCGANQPQPDGTSSEGHTGNGYARITFLG